MPGRYEFLLSSRSTCSWRRFALGLALLLASLLVFSGCGGGGDDGSGGGGGDVAGPGEPSAPVPVVASCEGDIFMQAPVEAIDTHMQTLTLLGLTLYVDGHTQFNNAHLEDLAVDDYVDVRGFSDVDDSIAASCLEREEVPRDEVELRGPVDPNGIATSRLFILGVEVQFSANTVFEDGSLTQAEFFAQLQPGDLVAVKGQLGSIHAEEVKFDDSADDLDDTVDSSSRGFDDYDDDDDFGLTSDLDDDDDGIPDDDDNGIDDDDNLPLQSPVDNDGVLDDDDDGILDDDDDGIDDDDNPPLQSPVQPPQPDDDGVLDDDDDGDSDDDDDDDGDNDNDDDDDD